MYLKCKSQHDLQNRVGKCCSGLDCSKTSESAVAQTCNKPPPTTTTTTTTTAAPTTTTTTGTTTTTSSSKCLTTSGAVSGAECQFPFIYKGQVYNSCTTAGGFSQPWCSTGTNIFGFHINSEWG